MHKFKIMIDLIKRDANIIRHDKNLLMILIIAPIFYSFFYTSIYFNKSENDVPISVIDLDNSRESRKIINLMDAHQLIKISGRYTNIEEAKRNLNNFSTQAIILIDKDYSKNIKTGQPAFIKAYLNTTRFLVSNDINKAINEIALAEGGKIRFNYFRKAGTSFEQAEGMSEPLKINIQPLFNPSEAYGEFIIPALLVLILQQTLLIGLGESIAREREYNLIPSLFKKSGSNLNLMLFGKTFFLFLLFSSYALCFFSIHYFLFKIPFEGNVLAFISSTLIFLITIILVGLFISSFFKRKIIALQVMAFTTYPIFFLTGYSFPYSALPESAKYISNLLPTTPYLSIMTRITQMGATWNHILPQLFHLGILMILYYLISLWRYRTLTRC